MKIKLLELFSGIGGFAKGLSDAGFEIETHLFSEIDKHAIACYKHNFKDAKHIGSVTDVYGSGIERPNIITFGSPCQDFSLAGNRAGLEGQRSSLVVEAIRIIGECRPDIFIWENVKGTFSSNAGADFWAIIAAFANIGGYRLEWQLVNTSWVLPQNRERIYLIGHIANGSTPSVFPIRESDFRTDERLSETAIVRAITAGGHSGGHHSGMTLVKQINESKESGGKQPYQQNRIYDTSGISTTLDQASGRWAIKSNTKSGYETANIGDGISLNQPNSKTRRGRVGKGVAQTIDTQARQGVLATIITRCHGFNQGAETDISPTLKSSSFEHNNHLRQENTIRRLTEIECERLQGFPDNWTLYGNYDGITKEIPKTQRYKLVGNAVTTNIVRLIGERLLINLLNKTIAA
jgi:DNA (cytosine-5)-methyltransferase 1